MTGHGYAYRCATCDGQPTWTLCRFGDAAVSWACDAHLADVCASLQRDFEVTEVCVTRREVEQ